jgi:hypothetical protein
MTQVHVKERPILFTGRMVQAILAGKKTQTRRVIKPQPVVGEADPWRDLEEAIEQCRYGQPGDRLWVREAYVVLDIPGHEGEVLYKADGPPSVESLSLRKLWKTPMFMKKQDARLWLEIESVGIERVQAILPEDAIAEGWPGTTPFCRDEPIWWFREVWDALYPAWMERETWTSNPWVWVLTFRRIRP